MAGPRFRRSPRIPLGAVVAASLGFSDPFLCQFTVGFRRFTSVFLYCYVRRELLLPTVPFIRVFLPIPLRFRSPNFSRFSVLDCCCCGHVQPGGAVVTSCRPTAHVRYSRADLLSLYVPAAPECTVQWRLGKLGL